MRPHIYLKKRSDAAFSGFLVNDPKAINEANANPFTESAGVGGPYSELSGWQEWAQEDWIGGLNRKTIEELGCANSSADTHVPGQITLPPAHIAPTTSNGHPTIPSGMSNTTVQMPTGGFKSIAQFYEGAGTYTVNCHVYMKYAGTLVVDIRAAGGANPLSNAVLATQTIVFQEHPNIIEIDVADACHWKHVIRKSVTIPAAGIWVIITPTVASPQMRIPRDFDAPTGAAQKYMDVNSAWQDCTAPGSGTRFPVYVYTEPTAIQQPVPLLRPAGDNIWALRGTSLYYYVAATQTWAERSPALSTTPVDICEFDGNIYIANGASVDMTTISGLGTPTTENTLAGIKATKLLAANGYLWRANGTLLYYTNDGTTWVEVTTPGRTIECMGSMEGEPYYATSQGIYYVAPGDFVVEVARYENLTQSPYYEMATFDGALWIIANENVFRLDSGRSLAKMQPFRHTEQPKLANQTPIALCTTQNRLFLLTQSTTTYNPVAMLMEWTAEGWHTVTRIGTIPGTTRTAQMLYDRASQTLFFCTSQYNYAINVSAAEANPFINQSAFSFDSQAWLEYPRYYGNRYALQKHFDAITLRAERLGQQYTAGVLATGKSTQVTIYWRAETQSSYTSLGTITTTDTPLRWTGADLAGTWVQFALLLQQPLANQTFRIRATILKYQSLLGDRARWAVPVEIDASQQVDGWTYTAAGIVADTVVRLKELLTATEPIIYKDTDGVQYEVSVQSYSKQLTKYDYKQNTDAIDQNYIYTLILEQLNPGAYTA